MSWCWWRGAKTGSTRSPMRSPQPAGRGRRCWRSISSSATPSRALRAELAVARPRARDRRQQCRLRAGRRRPPTLDRDEQLAMIDLNIRALTELSLAFVDSLARHRGGILNVASVAAFLPGPGMAVYYASKAYVLSFSEALHRELKPRGMRVTALCPGPVPTEFQARAGLRADRSPTSDADAVGASAWRRSAIDGFMRGKRVVVAGLANKLAVALLRLTPHALVLAGRSRGRMRRRIDALPNNRSDGRDSVQLRATASNSLAIMHQPILIVLHQEHSTPGRVGNALRELGYRARRAPAAVRRSAAGDHGRSCRRHHLRRPDERQRRGRFHPPRDRWIARAAQGEQAVSRHLSRRADVRAPARRPGLPPSRGPRRDRLLPDPADRRAALPSCEPGRNASTNGTAKVSTCRRGAELLAEGDTFEVQAIRYGSRPTRCNSIPT